MLNNFRKLFQPPTFDDAEQTRITGMLHVISMGTWLVPVALLVITAIFPTFAQRSIPVALAIVVINSLVSVLLRRGMTRTASFILIAMLVAATSYISYSLGAQPRPYILLFAWVILVAGLLLGASAATIVAIYFVALQAVIAALVSNGVITSIESPSSNLSNTIGAGIALLLIASTINLALRSIRNLYQQREQNAVRLQDSNLALTNLTNTLEARIESRTAELEAANQRVYRRARQFQAIGQVSKAIIATQNLQDVLPQIAEVISQQFEFYHAGIFLIDANREYAVLSAANSEGGERMLARGHKLRIGQTGIVGNVAKTGKVRVALDAGADSIYFNNPDLPETRSEMALPLFQASGGIIGILDIQSKFPNAFLQDDIEVLATLAEQVSVAITNARLYEETQRALIESEMFYRQDLKSGWKRFIQSQNLSGIRRQNMRSTFLLKPMNIPGAQEVERLGNTYLRPSDAKNEITELTIPMKLRGEVVGVLNIKSDVRQEWSADELDIITAIIDRAALSIENARLIDESRNIAARERTIGNISARIGEGTEIESILRIAVRELGAQISGARISVEIGGGDH